MSLSNSFTVFVLSLVVCLVIPKCQADANATQTSKLVIDANSGRPISDTFFGVFYEEINHAGGGGLWAELVSNRGFEAGGSSVPSSILPWTIIGDESNIIVSTDRSSCFDRNKVALRMDILCQRISCPPGGVGISNPGYWGMNIEQGKKYKIEFYVRATSPINLEVSFVGSNGVKLASTNIRTFGKNVANWTKMENIVEANATDHNSSLQITTSQKGIVWLDQVSAMPLDTYKGHGFRNDIFQMVADLKPKFLRFPGGCFVEGDNLRNAFRWKDTVGPWEQRPGHLNDIWKYWTDDGLGYFEGLQLAEDLGALPVWVFNNGISHHDEVDTNAISPFVQEALDGIEFARGSPTSQWGSLRASMGHPHPFDLKYVSIGNEDCNLKYFLANKYMKFYKAIRRVYPDIQIISNCDGSVNPLNHPADIYDFHIYTNSKDIFSMSTKFDNAPRSGPKVFVSEYAVWKEDAGNGSLLAAVAEAAFLIGLEKNSDIVSMVSYAPLMANINDRLWTPDAIVFNSYQLYGTPSYWLQQLFIESSGATLLNSTLQTSSTSLVASAIQYKNSQDGNNYIRVKVVNFGTVVENFGISINGLKSNVQQTGSSIVLLTSPNIMDENSFSEPNKIAPLRVPLEKKIEDLTYGLPPYSITSFDLLI
ncbi:alpha-L-arabinofuranosidase 1-like [Cicer arietinum]|uniref:non-reducing end alpha-L-arabinofuranosidase n=1 Tax=Cicer arietinum TaxID=3827 RepID=A0A1S3E1F8_CICAR|nr:alpha-L-arabinofuranosidase 1-like [Cicer arietinum]